MPVSSRAALRLLYAWLPRRKATALIALTLLNALTNGAGIVMLVPLLETVSNAHTAASPINQFFTWQAGGRGGVASSLT